MTRENHDAGYLSRKCYYHSPQGAEAHRASLIMEPNAELVNSAIPHIRSFGALYQKETHLDSIRICLTTWWYELAYVSH